MLIKDLYSVDLAAGMAAHYYKFLTKKLIYRELLYITDILLARLSMAAYIFTPQQYRV